MLDTRDQRSLRPGRAVPESDPAPEPIVLVERCAYELERAWELHCEAEAPAEWLRRIGTLATRGDTYTQASQKWGSALIQALQHPERVACASRVLARVIEDHGRYDRVRKAYVDKDDPRA